MSTTYRYKFTREFMTQLENWTSIHKYDDNNSFIDNWQLWCRSNELLIENEREKLEKNGYKKDIYTKMYKTVRYYLKNKKETKKEVKKRRQYISLDKELIESMDMYIEFSNKKPQESYDEFIKNKDYSIVINSAIEELKFIGLIEVDILNKIKKTYKNRYFIHKKLNEKQ